MAGIVPIEVCDNRIGEVSHDTPGHRRRHSLASASAWRCARSTCSTSAPRSHSPSSTWMPAPRDVSGARSRRASARRAFASSGWRIISRPMNRGIWPSPRWRPRTSSSWTTTSSCNRAGWRRWSAAPTRPARAGGSALLHRPPGDPDGAHGGRYRRARRGARPAALPREARAVRRSRWRRSGRSSVRTKTELVEFHCLLARRDVFDRLGPLDEATAHRQRASGPLRLGAAGGGAVYLEPAAVVTWMAPPPVAVVGSRLLPAPLE